jgi:hypothetical protein
MMVGSVSPAQDSRGMTLHRRRRGAVTDCAGSPEVQLIA